MTEPEAKPVDLGPWPMTAEEARDVTRIEASSAALQARANALVSAFAKRVGRDGGEYAWDLNKCVWRLKKATEAGA